MPWSEQALADLPIKNHFRLRGEAMTRLEVFSDAAFAFAMTMLVVSVGSIPQNYDELMLALKNIPAFALSFAQVAAFWIFHRNWSRQVGLEDKIATLLTLFMIFVILIYVYPLRLIFSSFFHFITGGWLASEFQVSSAAEMANLFIVYGLGYFCLALTLTLLHRHAMVQKQSLALNPVEVLVLKRSQWLWLCQALCGLLSVLFAWLMPSAVAVYAGFIYFILAIAIPVIYMRMEAKIKAELQLN